MKNNIIILIKKIIKKKNFLKIKLFFQNIFGNYITIKILGDEKKYLKLFKNYLKEKNNLEDFIKKNIETKDVDYINNLALQTQIVIKKSPLNYNHGFLIFYYLKKFLINNKSKKITILETGTARGFSTIIMSHVLKKLNINGKIHTIDVIPNNKKIYWNCISDPKNGKVTRKELLNKYKKEQQYISFNYGSSEKIIKKLNLERINFAFLDGSHDYEDVKIEYNYLKNCQKKGDIIFFDDVTPGVFDGIVKIVNEIKNENLYKVTFLNFNLKRGYALVEKKN